MPEVSVSIYIISLHHICNLRTLPKVNLLADMYNVYKHWMNTIIAVLGSQLNLDEVSFVMVDVG
jgi:hypothetical protein